MPTLILQSSIIICVSDSMRSSNDITSRINQIVYQQKSQEGKLSRQRIISKLRGKTIEEESEWIKLLDNECADYLFDADVNLCLGHLDEEFSVYEESATTQCPSLEGQYHNNFAFNQYHFSEKLAVDLQFLSEAKAEEIMEIKEGDINDDQLSDQAQSSLDQVKMIEEYEDN